MQPNIQFPPNVLFNFPGAESRSADDISAVALDYYLILIEELMPPTKKGSNGNAECEILDVTVYNND
jgi:hypothetical protein